jgi:hypothetical protein
VTEHPLHQRVERLKAAELLVYRMAFYLLQEEKTAIAAAKRTLLALAGREDWEAKSPSDREALLRTITIKEALQAAKDAEI